MSNEPLQENLPNRSGSAFSPSLLPLNKIKDRDFDVENLIFAGGGAKGFAYAGAVKVLERLGLLGKIQRFTGVGTGAIVAALLAVGYDCDQMQISLNEHLENIILDDQEGYAYPFPKFLETFGWNNGELFIQWLGRLLELRSTIPDVTFWQLFLHTGKELCIVATNVNKMCVEYFHAKTTPDIPIVQAVFTSLSIPGVFIPSKYRLGEGNSLYLNGSLLCHYPIHSYDGWWLSLKSGDFIPLRVEKASDFLSLDYAFRTTNNKSLGFVLLDKYLEADYDVFLDRLSRAGSNILIPDTVLGAKYKQSLKIRKRKEEKYQELRHAYFKILDLVGTKDRRYLNIEKLAQSVFTDSSLTQEEQNCLFCDHCESVVDCATLVKKISTGNAILRSYALRKLLRSQTIELIDTCLNTDNVDVCDLHKLFGAISHLAQNASFEVKECDFNRTVGIICGHIGSNDINLSDYDEAYLFQQGWNATVAYFQERITSEKRN